MLCKKGNIYSSKKCPICGSAFKYVYEQRALLCRNHPDQRAISHFSVKFGRALRRSFDTFDEAERFLFTLRYEVDQGSFDLRKHVVDESRSFQILGKQWLLIKREQVKLSSYKNLERYMYYAFAAWADLAVDQIGYPEIEDFLFSLKLSNKTRANIRSCLHTFFTWLVHRRVLSSHQFPDFPHIKFDLGYRKIIDKDTQISIIREVHRISYEKNPKIWLGIKWLATYIAFRPAEMTAMNEEDLDIKLGYFIARHTKENRTKRIPILPADKELIASMNLQHPTLPFFRHPPGISGCKADLPFGQKYLYKWWKKACANLGVSGVDLYGGTRHSSATALRKHLSPEQIKAGTMHSTNKAFERYFQRNEEEAVPVYELSFVGEGDR